MKAQDTVGYQIKTTWQSIAKMYNRLTIQHGYSQAIGYVLINVKKGGVPVTKIAPQMGIEPTSLSRLLNTMEEKGLIYRKKDTVDRRVVNLFLTEKGLEYQKVSKRIVLAYNNFIFDNFGKEEIDVFFKVIEKINALTNDISDENSFVKQ
ncbi:MAG: winged helix-turn-helix transcriptional regulator [Bacteroidales bacterium]|nr:winged helix-turn-helix transcriptional regulator [Bacteroidales bacterium]